MKKRQLCKKAHCDQPQISQVGVCAYHYCAGQWGVEWADQVYPDHNEAKANKRGKNNDINRVPE